MFLGFLVWCCLYFLGFVFVLILWWSVFLFVVGRLLGFFSVRLVGLIFYVFVFFFYFECMFGFMFWCCELVLVRFCCLFMGTCIVLGFLVGFIFVLSYCVVCVCFSFWGGGLFW